jgi:uncharacterized damage-inducible protein DinB
MRDLDRAELVDTLDFYRAVVVGKVAGLSREQATAQVLPSGTTLLGIVQHLTWVEDEWFRHCVLGEPALEWDSDTSFQVPDGASLDDVLGGYAQTCDRSRAIVAAAVGLDAPTSAPHWYFGITTLRYVLWHMTKETARHAGHADVLRELTDGATGFA